MSLHQVRLNFIYQLGEITPTYSEISKGFQVVDRLRLDPETGDSTGHARDFTVVRRRAESNRDTTDMSGREAFHEYELRIGYPNAIGLEADLDEMIETDRHQVCERLRDPQYFVGIPGAGSTAIGLRNRVRVFDERFDSGAVWVQLYRYRCLVREDV